jgi:hypothetical protein
LLPHRRISRAWLAAAAALVLASCSLKKEADNKFGDQHFKTAISLVELHKLRYGSYPASLAELKHTGEWDGLALGSVAYRRLPDGYALDLVRGWVGKPQLSYPPDFWQGLGLRESNVRKAPHSAASGVELR